jgi:hypothetical protein
MMPQLPLHATMPHVSFRAGDLSPLVLQMQLVRLCKDEELARALWENIISVRLTDRQFTYDFPWVLTEDLPIIGLLSADDVIDRATNMDSAGAFCGDHSISSAKPLLEMWDRLATATEDSSEVDTSFTLVDISIDTVTMNYVDLLLGPRMARFQIRVSDAAVTGGVAHYGVLPDLLTSVYSVVSSLAGVITMECLFFNTDVGTMEPFIEPFTLGLYVTKSETEEILNIKLSDSGQFVCNLSSAFLQTATSIALSLNQTASFKYFPEEYQQSAADAVSTGQIIE